MYGSWDMLRDGQTDGRTDRRTDRRKKWLIEVSAPPKMKFSIKDFFSKCDQIRRKLFIVNFEHILHFALVYLLLTLNI